MNMNDRLREALATCRCCGRRVYVVNLDGICFGQCNHLIAGCRDCRFWATEQEETR